MTTVQRRLLRVLAVLTFPIWFIPAFIIFCFAMAVCDDGDD